MKSPRPTALIADDEPLLRDELARQLGAAWPELEIVAEARNGREAIKHFEAKKPDVCFLDVHMPGVSGVEAAHAIGRRAHLVFVTAYDQYAVRAFAEGALDYLVKPVEAARLADTVARLKDRVAASQPALNTDMDAHTNVESLSFNVNHTDKAMPIVFIQNQQTRVSIPVPIPDANPLQPPLGLVQQFPSKFELMKETAKLSPIAALARGVARAAGTSDVVEGSGSLDVVRYGRLLKARGLVGVRGAGLAFDGLYFVKRVKSTLSHGSFKQEFSLTRNGLVSITPAVPA